MKKTFILLTFLLFSLPLVAKTKNLVYSNSFDAFEIETVQISLTYEDLKITQIYGDEISIEISSNNNKLVPEVSLISDDSSNLLKITSTVTRTKPGNKCTVYVYIPQDFVADTFFISLVSGNLQADFLSAQNNLSVSNVSGRTDISKLSTDFLQLSSVSGNITAQKLSDSFFQISNVSGSTFIELENPLLAKSSITSVTGKIQVYYKKNESPFLDDSPDLLISTVLGKVETRAY